VTGHDVANLDCPSFKLTISLIGLPGSGKSTVGRQLARRLQIPFYDSDRLIEERLGCSIREFFECEGEQRFRDIEANVLDELTQPRSDAVISTGGGSVLRPANRQCLRERTWVVYLNSSADELFRRLRHDKNRPLLQVADPLGRLREMYRQRHPLYQETAHFSVETGRPSVGKLVHAILLQAEREGVAVPPRNPLNSPA